MANLDFSTAFKYPFNRPKGMLNILWVLLPIIGWFALGGYTVRIVQEFIKGKFKQLPTFDFSNDLSLGFWMFLKSIPFMIAYMVLALILAKIPVIGPIISFLIELFAIPILLINFFKKETIASLFEFPIVNAVFNNFGEYIIVILKSLALGIIFLFMWIVLVGIPAGTFTQNIFLADFYRKHVK